MQNNIKNNLLLIIDKIYKYIKKHPKRSLLFCYIITALVVLLFALFLGLCNYILFLTGFFKQQELNVSSFEPIGIEVINDNTIITEIEDSQLILNGVGHIRSLHVVASFSQNPGEVNAFYLSNENADFSIQKTTYGKYENGTYSFTFPISTTKLRFDCGVTPSNTIIFESLIINRLTFSDLVVINGATLFFILVLPLIIIPVTYNATSIIKKYNLFAHFNKN